eukprot:8655336-Pyramimonas_sp.AAC.1
MLWDVQGEVTGKEGKAEPKFSKSGTQKVKSSKAKLKRTPYALNWMSRALKGQNPFDFDEGKEDKAKEVEPSTKLPEATASKVSPEPPMPAAKALPTFWWEKGQPGATNVAAKVNPKPLEAAAKVTPEPSKAAAKVNPEPPKAAAK